MKDLLFLSQRIPYPPDKGDKIRAFHMLRALSERYDIHLGCFVDDANDRKHLAELRRYCKSVFTLSLSRQQLRTRALLGLVKGTSFSEACYSDRRMAEWIAETMAAYGISDAFVFCSSMAPYLWNLPANKVLDVVDVDSEKWAAYAQESAWPMNWVYRREARELLALERRAVRSFDRALFVSPAEARLFLERVPEAAGRVLSVRNGVDTGYFDAGKAFASPFDADEKPVVFVGTMDYRPNIEAVRYFAASILPLVRKREPKARFWIVGANPVPAVRDLARDGEICVTGQVADVRPFLAHSACVVAPLTIARGIQNKVLEAFAMGCRVVATPQANEGIDARAGQELLIAGDAETFADTVCSVLAASYPEMGKRARTFVEGNFQWQQNLKMLETLFPESTPPADGHHDES